MPLISLKQSMKDRDVADSTELQKKTLQCYLAAIETVQKHAVELSPDELKDHGRRLGQLRRKIAENASAGDLDESRQQFETEVSEYNAKISKVFETSQLEVKEIIGLLREATGTMLSSNAHHDQQIRNFADSLETTSRCDDLRQIRMQLSSQVSELRICLARMQKDQAQALQPLQTELRSFEQRLQEAELLASTDPLTNLFNRREGEKRAAQKLRDRLPFCFLMIDLNRFKWINDRYGHLCGDQVLKMVARKLEEQVRSADVVCRWGGDEFLIILDCKQSQALQRSQQISNCLRGQYAVIVNGRKIEVEISASVGVSQCQPGDDLNAAFERADAMLYQIKQRG